jgi:hypothetical protein
VYARGNSVYVTNDNVVFRGHGGGIDGFSSMYLYSRQLDAGFSYSKNGFGGERELINLIGGFLSGGMADELPSNPIDVEEMKPFIGYYLFLNSRHSLISFLDRLGNSVRTDLKDDTLYIHRFIEEPIKMVRGEGLLFRKENGQYHTLFTKNKEGAPVLILNRSGYFEKVSGVRIISHRVYVFGSLFFLLLYVPFFMVWFVRALFGKVAWRSLRIRSVPFFAVLSLALTLALISMGFSDNMQLGTLNVKTVGVFVFSLLFAFFSIWSLWWGTRYFDLPKRRFISWYYLFTSMILSGFTLYLLLNNMIGLKMWAF